MAAAKDKIPPFDQSHVDYLKGVFEIGGAPGQDIIKQGPERTFAWVCVDQGYRDIVSHIQSLIDNAKAAG